MKKKVLNMFMVFILMSLLLNFVGCSRENADLKTVEFVTNGGSSVESVSVTIIDTEPCTLKTGYVFAGWYEQSDCLGERILFPYKVTKNVQLFAKWEKEGYVVSFNVNGGDILENIQASIIDKKPIPTKLNCKFINWYEQSDFSGKPVVFPFVVTENITLHAKWANKIVITVINGVGGGVFDEGDSVTLKNDDKNFIFEYWMKGDKKASFSNPYTFTAKDSVIIEAVGKFISIEVMKNDTTNGLLKPVLMAPEHKKGETSVRVGNGMWQELAQDINIEGSAFADGIKRENLTLEFWLYASNPLDIATASNMGFCLYDSSEKTAQWKSYCTYWISYEQAKVLRVGWNKVSINFKYCNDIAGDILTINKLNFIVSNNQFATTMYLHDVKLTSKIQQQRAFELVEQQAVGGVGNRIKVIENSSDELYTTNIAPSGHADNSSIKIPRKHGKWQFDLATVDLSNFDRNNFGLSMWIFVRDKVETEPAFNFMLYDAGKTIYDWTTDYQCWYNDIVSLKEGWNKISIKLVFGGQDGLALKETTMFKLAVYQSAFYDFYLHDVFLEENMAQNIDSKTIETEILNSDNSLKTLTIGAQTIELVDNQNVYSLNVTMPKVILKAIANSSLSKVMLASQVIGNNGVEIALFDGLNEINIKIIAENGDERIVRINIIKEVTA